MTELVRGSEWFLNQLENRAHSREEMKELVRAVIDRYGPSLLPVMWDKTQLAKELPTWDWYDLLEGQYETVVDSVLVREGIEVDKESRRLLLDCVRDAEVDAFKSLARNAMGDYSPDPKAQRFPPVADAKPNARPKLSITGLFEEYIKMLQADGQGDAAEKRWKPIVTKFVAFLKHDDAARVTKENVIAWRDHRLMKEGVSAKTVKDSDLASLRAIFQWATDDLKLPINPAGGVRVKLPKRVQSRSKGFTDGEALAVLKAAKDYEKPEKEYEETAAAKRWAPWLCAFTGARIVEICQLRKEDFSYRERIPVIRITPDAGSVKSGHYRDVPLHPQLVELGLMQFVASSKAGPLFHRTKPRSTSRKGSLSSSAPSKTNPASAVAATVGEWVNSLGVITGKVAPNHGWRHRFKTTAIEVGMHQRVADAIQDHAARTAGESYGDVTMKAKYDAVRMLPRYPVSTALP